MTKKPQMQASPKIISSTVVAEVVGCSDRQVRKVWADPKHITKGTKMAKTILAVTDQLETGTNKLIDQVKRTVKL